MKIFAFGHRKQVGKDTVVKGLVERFKEDEPSIFVYEEAFANSVYEVCYKLYGWLGFMTKEHYDLHPRDKEKRLERIGKTPREILIDLGTKGIRDNVWGDTWCQYLMEKYDPRLPNTILLISDLRFPNEFKAVKDAGGKCIRITRALAPISGDIADNALSDVKDWDRTFTNDGEPEQLIEEVYNELQNT